ncbi:MAG TPA: [Fe-Fe] hydrogenase large subunit C-terminal domain-containing protein, partial [Bacteroidales bacterium]|nr:[Fe-Fe] hydrogenase large subunit C-terminal domain-containing protein [Bacteroidales bacterium]
APSFPAEFIDIPDYRILVGMIRQLGFDIVAEVSFGADIVALQYRKLFEENSSKRYISSDCPAIVFYIEHYFPDLVPNLAPIASPMVAMARVIKSKYGKDTSITFIGPCISKKAESDEIDCVITFRELREIFAEKQIEANKTNLSDFDPPYSGKGAIFPINSGLLMTTGISKNFLETSVIVAEGRVDFREAIKEFETGLLKSHHLELLCCDGCTMGAGMSPNGKKFVRDTMVREYVYNKLKKINKEEWENNIKEFSELNLSQSFTPRDRRITPPTMEQIEKVLSTMGKKSPLEQLNCGACGYDTCVEHAAAVIEGLAEIEMCLPYTIDKLHNSIKELAISNEKLASAKQALKQSEKLASMGQLSAGIAHELNNPLGIITMYSNILKEELPENSSMRNDLELIVEQADRCKKIVSGLLNFARKNQVNYSRVNLIDFINLSINSVIVPDNVKVKVNYKIINHFADLDYDQMMQVMTNIYKNAIEAMPDGGELIINVKENNQDIIFEIKDTGAGISEENIDKIFTPFFTTKPIGKGTGLGLPIIYGIVKMHKGKIEVISNDNPKKGETGTCFKIIIPRNKPL